MVEQRALISDLPLLETSLGRIAVPARILAGSADRIVPISSLRMLSDSIAGAQLELIEGAGHLLPLRQPQAVVQAIGALG